MTVSTLDLTKMTGDELDTLFSQSPSGHIPSGRSRGTAVVFPGSPLGRVSTALIRWIAWKGKVFDPEDNDLLNIITPFGVKAIRARTYHGTSWLDGDEAVILDYSRTSFVAQKIRDEIRQVGPGIYLGQVFWGKKRILRFLLEF